MKQNTKHWKKLIFLTIFIGGIALPLFANTAEGSITERMTELVLQIAIILFAARVGGTLMKKIHMPSVLGELLAGIVIGPYLLGGVGFPGLPHGLFPIASPTFPVSPELYGIATIASIILLFLSGLETDIDLFLSYSVKGAVIGIGGVIISFFAGAGCGVLFFDFPFMHPVSLFLGVLSIATSVGITARILSEQRKMDSPEGVTILAAAVIDDVLGIILLAIVLGIVSVLSSHNGGTIDWGSIGRIALKAVGVWLGFTVLGLFFSRKISRFLKIFKSRTSIAIMSLGLALLLSGIFEEAGLAMIIGAYVMGLSLSKTDLNFVIQDRLHPVHDFFVPIFFCVMGMMVNVQVFTDPQVLLLGLAYSIICVVAKVIGCGLPSLFMQFNLLGASRIGVGMVPRGEVALIIAGIGYSTGILDNRLFGIAILMTLITTLLPPPVLSALLRIKKRGTRREMKGSNSVTTPFSFPSLEMTELAVSRILKMAEQEGFFIQGMELDNTTLYQIRKETIFISMEVDSQDLVFSSDPADVVYVKTLVYESLLNIHETLDKLKDIAKPEELKKELADSQDSGGEGKSLGILKKLTPDCIIMNLKGNTKDEVIHELVNQLEERGKLLNREVVLEAVLTREKTMSTGMQHGIALPHGKSSGVDSLEVAIGLKPEGIDFQSLDGEPSRIFIMVVSPLNSSGPHIQFLSSISAILKKDDIRKRIFECNTPEEVNSVFKEPK